MKTQGNVYLILEREGENLYLFRTNTGYQDGRYGLVSGHIENGESAMAAMVREAKEEVGIVLQPEHLVPVHCIHRKTNRQNFDWFFKATMWEGEPTNCEPVKCGGLLWSSEIPENTVPYISSTLRLIDEGGLYSESGWEQTLVLR